MKSNLQAVVAALKTARQRHQQHDASGPELALADCEEAYAVQSAMGRELGWWPGGVPRHWKTGGPGVDAVQTSAPLPDRGVWAGPCDARAWPMHSRGVESEIALRLKTAVTPEQARDIDAGAARSLIGEMAVAIELVDFRWRQGMDAPELLKLADLQSHGALVLGEWVPYAARDWSAQQCRTWIGAQPEVLRQGSHSFGDPTLVLHRWLRHATARFGTLAAGTVVTTGTWVGLLHAQPGDLVKVQFDGIGQTSVQL